MEYEFIVIWPAITVHLLKIRPSPLKQCAADIIFLNLIIFSLIHGDSIDWWKWRHGVLTVEETKVPPQRKLCNCVPPYRRLTCEGSSPRIASLPPKTFQCILLLWRGNTDALLSYFVYSNENGLVIVPASGWHIGPGVGLGVRPGVGLGRLIDPEQSQ